MQYFLPNWYLSTNAGLSIYDFLLPMEGGFRYYENGFGKRKNCSSRVPLKTLQLFEVNILENDTER